jgi:hypothetical protein
MFDPWRYTVMFLSYFHRYLGSELYLCHGGPDVVHVLPCLVIDSSLNTTPISAIFWLLLNYAFIIFCVLSGH